MSKENLKVMTVTISKKLAEKVEAAYSGLLRRDSHLTETLDNEIESLKAVPALSDDEVIYSQLKDQLKKEDKTKIGLKLPEYLVEKINSVCKDKRVSRDLFISTYLNFLANGYQDNNNNPMNSVISPLVNARAYLDDPYKDMDGSVNIYEKRFCIPSLLADLLVESLQEDLKSERNERG
jgi:metal-responsive CopG/Arc/MetJ family transcriptional regulator